jgi:hypothetical protein
MGLVDFDRLLNAATQTVFGETAVLTPIGVTTGPLTLSAIFDNRPMADPGNIDVGTIRPVAAVRMSEIVAGGLSLADLAQAGLVLNGRSWRVESAAPDPTPRGEGQGEVMLILIEVD